MDDKPYNAALNSHAIAARRLPSGWRLTLSSAWAAFCIAACVAATPGCTVCHQAKRTVICEPLHYSWKIDRHRSVKAYREWADQAWAIERRACPEFAASEPYALGFRDGFVDLVYAGGDGEPPPIPPRQFWNLEGRSPQGKSAASDWFAGYRHGARVARDGGYRQRATVSSSFVMGGFGPEILHPYDMAPLTESGEPVPPPTPEPQPLIAPDDQPGTLDNIPPAPAIPDGEQSLPPPGPPVDAGDGTAASQFKRAIFEAETSAKPLFTAPAKTGRGTEAGGVVGVNSESLPPNARLSKLPAPGDNISRGASPAWHAEPVNPSLRVKQTP